MLISSSSDTARSLEHARWGAVEAVVGVDRQALASVLVELADEDCAHTWRRYASIKPLADAVDALVLAEQRARPTTFFNYWGLGAGGKMELIGVGTIAERIRHDFCHDGFPVIARAYIRRRFRGRRVYPMMLVHRLEYCKLRWRDELAAIHLGSSSAAVTRCLSGSASLSPAFVRVGTERLGLGRQQVEVGAFLAFADAYADRLRTATPAGPARDALESLLAGEAGGLASFRAQLAAAGLDEQPTFTPLLTLCRDFEP